MTEADRIAAGALVLLAGAAGASGQAVLGTGLEAMLGSVAPALTAEVLALALGSTAGAAVARGQPERRGRVLLIAGALFVALGAIELAGPRVPGAFAHAPVAARVLVGAPLLVLPSAVAGALVALIAHSMPRRASSTFALGLAGAAAGALGATFAAVATAGGAEWAARAGAIAASLAGGLAVTLATRMPRPLGKRDAARTSARPHGAELPGALGGAAAHGVLGGAALVVGGHLARAMVGVSAETLGAWFAAILAGMAAGTTVAHMPSARRPRDGAARAIAAAGLAVTLALVVWGALPSALAVGATFLRAPADLALLQIAAALATCALPAAWVTASFQLLLRETRPHDRPRASGAAIAGAILGAAVVGVALPALGSRPALVLIALGYAVLSLALARGGGARGGAVVTAFTVVVLVALARRWGPSTLAFGPGGRSDIAWARESIGAGAGAASGDALAANGRVFELDAEARRAALLAAIFAPRLGTAAAIDDVAAAAALLRAPWSRVWTPYVTAAWIPHVPGALKAALDDPRASRLSARGGEALHQAPSGLDALVASVPPGCGPGCARALLDGSRRALGDDGVALVIARDADPASLGTLARAARAVFPHAGLAALGDRAVVLASSATLTAHPERLDPTHSSEATDALRGLVARDDAIEACADAIMARGEATASALQACADPPSR